MNDVHERPTQPELPPDMTDPRWVELRAQLADEGSVSDEEEAAFRQWLETGKPEETSQ